MPCSVMNLAILLTALDGDEEHNFILQVRAKNSF